MTGKNKGIANGSWNGGITSLTSKIRSLPEYREWRTLVFERDVYTCSCCNKKGGNLVAHHKIEFFKIFNDFLKMYPQYNPIDDKEMLRSLSITYSPFWDISNGVTVCKEPCHLKICHGGKFYAGI